jgi:hypothetical protein
VRFTDPSQLLGMELEVNDPRRPGSKIRLSSGVNASNLAVVMDKLTTGGTRQRGQEILRGRVNINSAPKAVLASVPGLDEELAQRVVDLRGGLDEQTKATTAWLFTQNVVGADVFKTVAPWITARSYQFRIHSIGYQPSGGRFCVLEAVVDLGSGRPRISYLRDLTRLGVPFGLTGIERG